METTPLTKDQARNEALLDAAIANPAGGFISITGYTSKAGEVADHLINGTCSWAAALQRSLDAIANLTADSVAVDAPPAGGDVVLAQRALDEVRASWTAALARIEADASASPYTSIAPGVDLLDSEPGAVYLWGLAVGKRVTVTGEYKPVNSKPLTLVKRWIEAKTSASHFRRFKLTSDSFERLAFAGRVIVPADLVGKEVVVG
jgi:hypothetical protein